ncbi:hypothetical protein ACJX0J_032500, partial [Zea mays]
ERLRKRLGLEEATKNKGFDLGNGGKTQNVSVPTVEGVARGTSYGWVDGGLRGTNLGAGVIDPTNVHSDNLLHVWSMPSTANVSQQEAPRPLEKVNLLAARNERESFQIALRPKVSWATSGIAGSVLIQCTDLCSSSGDRYENSSLPEDRIGELVKETLAAVGLKVVPTEYKYLSKKILPTNQGSVTEYFLSIRPTERAWPAVYFLYDLSPITFTIKEERRNFLHFITRLCAVLGGTFAMTGPHLSREKDNEEEESDRDGFFRRLLRDSKEEDMELTPSSDGLLKRLFRDKEDRQGEDDEKDFFRRDSNHARHGNEERLGKSVEDDDREGFFRKIFKDKNEERKDEGHQKPDEREKVGANIEDDKRDGFFRQLFKEKNDEKKEGSTPSKKEEDDKGHKNADDDNFFRRLFKDKNEEKKGIVHDRNEDDKCEEGDKENFFRKLFKDKLEERRTEGPDKNDDYGKGSSGIEEEDNPEFLSFRRLFRVHPEDPKSGHIESSQSNNLSEGSLGSESFFKRLFRDRDRSLEDSEIFGSKMAKEKHPGTTGINEKQSGKPPLPINAVAELRKGSYYASLELVQALCDTSYGLVDIFPIEDRKIALRESLIEINSQIASAEKNGDDFCLCFPMGKGIYRVVHIPEDESVLLNSREKAPYLICVEVLKAEAPSHSKGSSDGHKLSKDGIPLANGDVQLPKPPPWAYPLWSRHETQNYETDIMLKSTSQVIDQAMAQLWETKVKFVNVSFSIEKLGRAKSIVLSETGRRLRHDATDSNMIVCKARTFYYNNETHIFFWALWARAHLARSTMGLDRADKMHHRGGAPAPHKVLTAPPTGAGSLPRKPETPFHCQAARCRGHVASQTTASVINTPPLRRTRSRPYDMALHHRYMHASQLLACYVSRFQKHEPIMEKFNPYLLLGAEFFAACVLLRVAALGTVRHSANRTLPRAEHSAPNGTRQRQLCRCHNWTLGKVYFYFFYFFNMLTKHGRELAIHMFKNCIKHKQSQKILKLVHV